MVDHTHSYAQKFGRGCGYSDTLRFRCDVDALTSQSAQPPSLLVRLGSMPSRTAAINLVHSHPLTLLSSI